MLAKLSGSGLVSKLLGPGGEVPPLLIEAGGICPSTIVRSVPADSLPYPPTHRKSPGGRAFLCRNLVSNLVPDCRDHLFS